MKAVLVINEMPTRCCQCKFFRFVDKDNWDSNETYCIVATGFRNEDGMNTKAEWCPLRTLPERKEMPKNYANRDYTQGIVDGWNRCWDEVTGVIWD